VESNRLWPGGSLQQAAWDSRSRRCLLEVTDRAAVIIIIISSSSRQQQQDEGSLEPSLLAPPATVALEGVAFAAA